MKINVAIYARVSSDQQVEADSVDRQIITIKEYVRNNLGDEYEINEDLIYHDDGISGYYTTVLERPAMVRMLQDAKLGKFQVAVFKEISRMGRDNEELIKLPRLFESRGVRVISLDAYDSDMPDRKILLPFKGMFAEMESDRISLRVSEGQRAKARQGEWSGHVPLGYSLNKETKRLEIDENEAEIVRLMFDLYGNHKIGGVTIATKVNSMGYRTKKGMLFNSSRISEILTNQVYIGRIVYGKNRMKVERVYDDNNNLVAKRKKYHPTNNPIIFDNAHQPIIDELLFWTVQEMKASKNVQKRITGAKHPLVKILFCAHCGTGLICQTRKAKKTDWQFRYYKCNRKHHYGETEFGCKSDNIRADILEQRLFEEVMKHLNEVKRNRYTSKNKNSNNALDNKIKQLENEKKKISRQQIQLTQDRDLYTQEIFREIMLGYKNQIENYDKQIEITKIQLTESLKQKDATLVIDDLLNNMSKIDLKNFEQLRAFFLKTLEKVIVRSKEDIDEIKFVHAINS